MRSIDELERLADRMRDNPTPAEAALAEHLATRLEWQAVIGPFIADFADRRARVIVEADGGVHETSHQRQYDEKRDQWFAARGWLVLRYKNEEILRPTSAALIRDEVFGLCAERRESFSDADRARQELSDLREEMGRVAEVLDDWRQRCLEAGAYTTEDIDRYHSQSEEEFDFADDRIRVLIRR